MINVPLNILLFHNNNPELDYIVKEMEDSNGVLITRLLDEFDLYAIDSFFDCILFFNDDNIEKSIIFCRQINNTPELSYIPVLFINKNKNAQSTLTAFDAGCSDIINMPCNLEELLIRIKQQIKNKNLIKELHNINKTKDKFLSIISHDLRNPFTILLNFSEILYQRFDNFNIEMQKDYIKFINESAKQSYTILENLLRWIKANTGEIKYNPTRVNLTGIIYESILLLVNETNRKKLKIYFNHEKDYFLYADRNMLNVIFNNLIRNAIKYSYNEGSVIIDITENEKKYEISISDKGTGIEENRLEHLFILGEVVKTPGTNNELGAGLGLLIIKEFIDKHNGTINVKSIQDEGSTFIVTLPVEA